MAEQTRKRRKRTTTTASTVNKGRVTEKSQPKRYTPPTPASYRSSPRWVPIFMFGFFGLGVMMIILNYLPNSPLIPGETSNWYLLGGLGLICLGFIAATRYK